MTEFKEQTQTTEQPPQQEEILTGDMLAGELEQQAGDDLQGMDAMEFASLVAEVTAGFMPSDITQRERNEYKARYIGMVGPLLQLGGFEKLTAGMDLGDVVDKYPWVGLVICSGAILGGVYFCWPKKEKEDEEETTEPQPQGGTWNDGSGIT